MISEIKQDHSSITVYRAPGSPRVRSESAFWYILRNHLRAAGFDVVKRNLEQDGHMMGDRYVYYLRERKWRWGIYDDLYAVRDIARDFNQDGRVYLQLEPLEGDEVPDLAMAAAGAGEVAR